MIDEHGMVRSCIYKMGTPCYLINNHKGLTKKEILDIVTGSFKDKYQYFPITDWCVKDIKLPLFNSFANGTKIQATEDMTWYSYEDVSKTLADELANQEKILKQYVSPSGYNIGDVLYVNGKDGEVLTITAKQDAPIGFSLSDTAAGSTATYVVPGAYGGAGLSTVSPLTGDAFVSDAAKMLEKKATIAGIMQSVIADKESKKAVKEKQWAEIYSPPDDYPYYPEVSPNFATTSQWNAYTSATPPNKTTMSLSELYQELQKLKLNNMPLDA